MFEKSTPMRLTVGSVSPFARNLSVLYVEAKSLTYACTSHRFQVNTVCWDAKQENVVWDSIVLGNQNSDRPNLIIEVRLVHPTIRSAPLIVVATTNGVQIFDTKTHKIIIHGNIDLPFEAEPGLRRLDYYTFCRGITWSDNTIVVGTHTGHIMQFLVTGETSISAKRSLVEHSEAIVDIANCRFDDLTCSCDMGGNIVTWQKNLKGVMNKISTKHPINCINVLRKQVIVGTLRGKMLLYNTANGALMAELHVHTRPVTCISVAPESAYVLSAGEDGRFVVFKLHTRKPHAYQLEFRFTDEIEHSQIMGAQFTNGRGSSIAISCYDQTTLHMYRIIKKTP